MIEFVEATVAQWFDRERLLWILFQVGGMIIYYEASRGVGL